MTLFTLSSLGLSEGRAKTAQRIGDLVITLVDTEEHEGEGASGDHRPVVIGLQATNVGKQALCVRLSATLKATFGLEYHASIASPHAFQIQELLPGERTEGEYEFLVKRGVEPLQLVLKPTSESQTCARGNDSLSAIWHSTDRVILDLAPPHGGTSQEPTSSNSFPSRGAGIRVFVTDRKGDNRQGKVIEAFSQHCPQTQITTKRENANYIVQLTPASLTQTKNVVVVTNEMGDVIHSGETFNLGNAAKDACAVILNDFNAKSKQ